MAQGHAVWRLCGWALRPNGLVLTARRRGVNLIGRISDAGHQLEVASGLSPGAAGPAFSGGSPSVDVKSGGGGAGRGIGGGDYVGRSQRAASGGTRSATHAGSPRPGRAPARPPPRGAAPPPPPTPAARLGFPAPAPPAPP